MVWLFGLLVCGTTPIVAGGDTLSLTGPFAAPFSIGEYARVYVDTSLEVDPARISAALLDTAGVALADLPYLGKFRQGRYAYWVEVVIRTGPDLPPSTYLLHTKVRDSMELFQLEAGTLVERSLAGYDISKTAHGEVPSSNRFALPLPLEPDRGYRVLLRLRSSPTFVHRFGLHLHPPGYDFRAHDRQLAFPLFALGGFFFCLLFAGLFGAVQYLVHRDRAYLYYAGYLGAIALFYWRVFGMQNPRWFVLPAFLADYWYYLPLQFAAYVAYVYFIRHFLDTPTRMPRLDRFLRIFLLGLGIVFLIDRILHGYDAIMAYTFVYWSRLVIHTVSIFFLVYLSRYWDHLSRYILIGTGILLLSMILTQIIAFDKTWIEGFFDASDLPSLIGLLLEVFCFSLGLGYRTRQAQRDKHDVEVALKTEQRESERLRELVTSQTVRRGGKEPGGPAPAPPEDMPFLTRVEAIARSRLADEHFGPTELAAGVFLSESQVYRKLKAETGLSTTLYLRDLRLREARKLLRQTDLSVAEISLRTGFRTPSYFSQCFRDAFSLSPTGFRNREQAAK